MVSEKLGLATLMRNRRGNKFLQRNERWESWVEEAGLKRCETWERGKGGSQGSKSLRASTGRSFHFYPFQLDLKYLSFRKPNKF